MAAEWVRKQRQQGRVAAPLVQALAQIGTAIDGCERLASTPTHFTYGEIVHRTIYLYCLRLPFGLVDSIGPMTPVAVVFIAYTFSALEALASELEDPFGTSPNDLALQAICWTIENSVLESLGVARDQSRRSRSPKDYVLR